MSEASLNTIETRVPSRLDRLPWARFHWMIVVGLGTVWILDGLEVTIVGSIGARLTESDSGLALNASQIGTAAAFYVAGACLGALFFGKLTDRFGRRKLFLLTLGVYIAATVATAFAFAPWYFFLMRFLTGAGIGGEYAAINSAIDELIPARNRGRVDLIINGTFWFGAALGALGSLVLLDTSIFPADIGWRLAFAIGAVLGVAILLVRRNVPESPRWLFIHGREDEAEQLVDRIEREVLSEIDEAHLPKPEHPPIKIEQREKISFRQVAHTAFTKYPTRTVLGLSLFVGQAFLYNAITFDLGTILSKFYGVASGAVPFFIAIFAISNFLGPVVLGRYFDTIGRRPMITFTYGGAAVLAAALAIVVQATTLTEWSFLAFIVAIFFIASAGASSAYLTVSEIFPMETRAMAIAFFYAIGTAVGGITGPLLFGHLINTGETDMLALGFLIGAAVMLIGAIAELAFGVRAERQPLEQIAKPLTAETVEQSEASPSSDDETADRIAQRTQRRRERETRGARRFRPGRGGLPYSPALATYAPLDEPDLDAEIDIIKRALAERGATERRALSRLVGGRYWGPGRFRLALREAIDEGSVDRVARNIVTLSPSAEVPADNRSPASSSVDASSGPP